MKTYTDHLEDQVYNASPDDDDHRRGAGGSGYDRLFIRAIAE